MSLRKLMSIGSRFLPFCIAITLVLALAPMALAKKTPYMGVGGGGATYNYRPGNAAADASKIADMYNKWRDMEDKAIPPGGSGGPEYNPPGMPEVPTACGENQDCWSCYEQANKQLERLRVNFEKLRILYKETDDFTKAAMAFGDSAAGASNLGGIEWTAQRLKILKSWKNFEKAYRRKHNQLVGKLKEALQEVAKCEKQYFGVDDWYARYGYMFHSFMAMHYQK
jgi:hypothetical protein